MNNELLTEYKAARAKGWWATAALQHAKDKVNNKAMRYKYDAYPGQKQTIKVGDASFVLSVEYDDWGLPWENQDTLGDIKRYVKWDSDYDKLPEGYVWLQKPGRNDIGYAYHKSAALTNVQSWGRSYSPELAENMVADEMAYCKEWLNNEWAYVVVSVARVCNCCNDGNIETHSLGMVENRDHAYVCQVIDELLKEHGVSNRDSVTA